MIWNDGFVVTFAAHLWCWQHLRVFGPLPDVPSLPGCGVRHSFVLYCSPHWHIDWVQFKSPVLPLLFTPIVNLYNAVKDCFTHLGYIISSCSRQTGVCQPQSGKEHREEEDSALPWRQMQCNSTIGITLKDAHREGTACSPLISILRAPLCSGSPPCIFLELLISLSVLPSAVYCSFGKWKQFCSCDLVKFPQCDFSFRDDD